MESYSEATFERDELERIIRLHMPESADVLCGVLLPGITFVHGAPPGQIALRLGGGAPLPESMDWPVNGDRDLYHIATVDLGVVGSLDESGALPCTGLLLFFYDVIGRSWGLDPGDTAPWRVIWLDLPDSDELPLRHRRPHPTDAEFIVDTEIEPEVVSGAAVTWTLPMDSEPCVAETFYGRHSWPEYQKRCDDFEAIRSVQCRDFLMLGWPFYEQPNSRQWSVAADSTGRSWGEIDAQEVAEWRLLMQFDCWNEYGGTNWGGAGGGMLEFWIKDADLRARRFDRVWIQVDVC
jgi:hypothetical protein